MKNINNFYSDTTIKIIPYQWEEGVMGRMLRFETNTLPYPPKSLLVFVEELKKKCPINEYFDSNYTRLKKLIAQYEGVKTDMVTVTNSGDEAIDILAKAFFNPGDYFVTTPPTYEMFDIQCSINRGINLPVALKPITWDVDAEKIIKKSQNPKVKLIFSVNPNNPTASIIPEKILEKIISKSAAIVVVDEVYREFYGKSANKFLSKYKNLVILRSLSKFAAMAGARIGYLIANPEFSQKFNAIRFPMGVSYFSYKLTEFVLEKDQMWIKKQVEMIKKERTRLINEISIFGFYVYPSYANFLLVKIGKRATEICQKLKRKGIIIRDRSQKKYLAGCVRITIRSQEENNQLIKALEDIIYEKD